MMRRNLLSESVASVSSLPANTVFKLGTNGLVGAQNNIFLDTPTNSRTANTITRYGNTTQGTFTPYSKEAGKWSNWFDGGAGYLSIAGGSSFNLSSSSFEISCYFFAANTGNRSIVQQKEADWRVNLGGDNKLAWVSNGAVRITSDGSIVQNSFNKATISCDGTTTRMYLNDVLQTQTTTVMPTNSIEPVYVGVNKASIGDVWRFGGYISNLKITKAGTVVLDTCKDNRFKDNSVFNHTLTPTGNVKVSPFSPYANSVGYDASVYGGSGCFDGTTDYGSIPHSTNFNFNSTPFELTVDVYPLTTVGYRYVVAKSGSGGVPSFGLIQKDDGKFYFSNGTSGAYTLGVVPANAWSSFKVFYDGSTATLYLNGVFQNSQAMVISDNSYPVTFGSRNAGAECFNGYISNLRITKAGTEVLNLKFNNAGIRDESGMNCIETVGDAKVSSDGQGVVFDGSGDYLTSMNNQLFAVGTGDFSISFDITTGVYSSGTSYMVLSVGDGSDCGIEVPFYGQNYLSLRVCGTNFVAKSNCAANTTYNIKIWRTNGIAYMSVDGGAPVSATFTNNLVQGYKLNIGARGSDNSFPFKGTIKNLTITKGA